MRRTVNNSRGFSLVEVAIALVIIGLFTGGLMQGYKIFAKQTPARVTKEKMRTVQTALEKFVAKNGRLPCPASLIDKWVTPVAATAGKEVSPCVAVPAGTTITKGAVPYVTLGLSMDDAVDGWQRKILYAVTTDLTSAAKYDPDGGTIYVLRTNGTGALYDGKPSSGAVPPPTTPAYANATAPYPFGTAQVFLVSYGQNRMGGYDLRGSLANAACSAPSNPFDYVNCNPSYAFFFNDEGYSPGVPMKSTTYDDLVNPVYILYPFSDKKWGYSGKVDTVTQLPASMRSFIAGGRVGIGLNGKAPAAQLDVDGNIRAKRVYVEQLCDASGANCFAPSLLANDNYPCGGAPIKGFQNGKPICADIPLPASTSTSGPTFIGCGITGGVLKYKATLTTTTCASP